MDNNSLEQLIKKHHHDAFLWACQCCYYDQEEGKEVLQQAYAKIAEGKAKFKEQSTFKTWLFSIIRFTAIDHMKQNKRFDSLDDVIQLADTDGDLEIKETINYRELLKQLPERQQQVLLLSFYHGLTLVEIAKVVDLHIGTVRTHYERAKTALKKRILIERKYG